MDVNPHILQTENNFYNKYTKTFQPNYLTAIHVVKHNC